MLGAGVSPAFPGRASEVRRILDSYLSAGAHALVFDHGDLGTKFVENTGITQAGYDDVVGLELDKSQGLVYGPELAIGPFTVNSESPPNSTVTIDGLSVTIVSDGTGAGAQLTGILETGKTFVVEGFATVASGTGVTIRMGGTDTGEFVGQTTSGGFRYVLKCVTSTDFAIARNGTTNTTVTITSIRQLLGSHASQTTTAAKPILKTADSQGLGEELTTNGGLSSWTGDNPDWWGLNVPVEDANNFVTQVGNAARCFSSVGSSVGINTPAILTVGKTYKTTFTLVEVTGTMRFFTTTSTNFTTPGVKEVEFVATSTGCRYILNGSGDFTITDISVKEVTTKTHLEGSRSAARYLQGTNPLTGDALTLVYGAKSRTTPLGDEVLFACGDSADGGSVQLIATAAGDLKFTVAGVAGSATATHTPSGDLTDAFVATVRLTASTLTLQYNNDTPTSGTVTTPATLGNLETFSIGALFGSVASAHSDANHYGCVAIDVGMTDAEVAQNRSYIANKAGVVL